MPTRLRTDELCRLWVDRVKETGSVTAAAKRYKTPITSVQSIVDDARMRWPDCLPTAVKAGDWAGEKWTVPARPVVDVRGKRILTGGDLHRWPGPQSLAWQAFIAVANDVKPDIIVLGGDMLDGARVSRHDAMLNSNAPKLKRPQRLIEIVRRPLVGRIGRFPRVVREYPGDGQEQVALGFGHNGRSGISFSCKAQARTPAGSHAPAEARRTPAPDYR